MKNALAFIFVWGVVTYGLLAIKDASWRDRAILLKALCVGGLTALLTIGILTALVILF